jgi:asparagine synthase (glutamine-hydrolysing)
MAGIAGLYCADGRPAEIAEVRRMANAVAHRGVDGISYWSSGPVAFAHLQFCTTPESLEERQPLVSPSGEACLVWDGRLDNREELKEALASEKARLVDQTDPGLVLTSYLLWGTECVKRFVGDFALAVWDARLRQLWCARDYIGVRPFYYFWDGKTLLFAPEIRALLSHPLVSLKINEGMVGEYLAAQIVNREETFYSDIRRAPPGSTLTIDSSGGLRVGKSWWDPDLTPLEYRTDEEYAEHFRHLMERSVRDRMRCNAAWGAALSGGLDSSTIAVTAQALLNQDADGHHQVRTFSLVSPGKPWDESEYIAEIAQFAGLQSEPYALLHTDQEFFRRHAAWTREFPDYPAAAPLLTPMFDAAKRHGMRVLLAGIGGNEWLDGSPLHVSDWIASLVRTGTLRQSLQSAISDWKLWSGPRRWQVSLFRQLISAAMPDSVLSHRKKLRFTAQSFLSREFMRRTHLADRLYSPSPRGTHNFTSHEQREIFHNAVSGMEAHVLELNDREVARSGLETRYPFLDRRLAEFCLRLPREQRQKGVAWKWVLRNAMRERLPESVRTKTFQAEFSDLYAVVLYDPWARARLKNLAILKHTDWLDPRRLAARLELPARPDSEPSFLYRPAWMVLAMDLWLENLLSSGGQV